MTGDPDPQPTLAEGSSASDEELVRRMNRGQATAFDALYLRHRDWVVSVALRFTKDRDEALDVLQETFRYFLGKFPGFELSARLTTFLYPVVRNIALTLRRKKRPDLVGDALLAGAEASREAEDRDSREDLAIVLARLSDAHRETLVLRYVDDLSLEEIAAILEVPLGTVKSRIHHALKALREDPACRRYFEP